MLLSFDLLSFSCNKLKTILLNVVSESGVVETNEGQAGD